MVPMLCPLYSCIKYIMKIRLLQWHLNNLEHDSYIAFTFFMRPNETFAEFCQYGKISTKCSIWTYSSQKIYKCINIMPHHYWFLSRHSPKIMRKVDHVLNLHHNIFCWQSKTKLPFKWTLLPLKKSHFALNLNTWDWVSSIGCDFRSREIIQTTKAHNPLRRDHANL